MVLSIVILSALLIVISILPFIQNQHWVFRAAEFAKLQLLLLQVIVLIITFFYVRENPFLWYFQIAQLFLIGYHSYLLAPFTKFWKTSKMTEKNQPSHPVKIISCNIYQFNKDFHRFIALIQKEQPDLFLTMESNSDWEKAMRVLEKDYPNYEKVTLENTYGMHFYTKLKTHRIRTHYFVSDDLPSIEAELETKDGQRFIFFGVHPPPPSPTEEDNSKERDGDILSVAKKVKDATLPVLVTGDFNNVAWARSSVLFRKTSGLIDARIGRGILSSFHSKYWVFRVPLDLLFHSPAIFIDKLFRYPSVGSDHFPIGCSFHIDKYTNDQEREVQHPEQEEKQEVEELITKGQEEVSENRDTK